MLIAVATMPPMSARFPGRISVVVFALAVSISAYALNSSKWIEVVGGAWKPDVTILSELETVLKPAVITASKNRGRMPDWSTYTFQYQGRSPVSEKQYVFVNAFCDETKNHRVTRTKAAHMLPNYRSCYAQIRLLVRSKAHQ